MKISDVTAQVLADYARLDEPGEIELSELQRAKESAIALMMSYTGIDDINELDAHEDLTHALFVLVMDMFDNRNYLVDKKAINPAVQIILNLHSVNLL